MSKRKALAIIAVLVLLTIWVFANPPGRFGWCAFAVTTYSSIPRLVSDQQIRSDGERRKISKTHELGLEQIKWLLDPKPDELIIAIGWRGATKPSPELFRIEGVKIHVLKNDDAIEMFNRLKKQGVKVAIHYHSTC